MTANYADGRAIPLLRFACNEMVGKYMANRKILQICNKF
jgi:hypothetical protein